MRGCRWLAAACVVTLGSARAQTAAAQTAAAQPAGVQTAPDVLVRTGAGGERRVPVVTVETRAGPRDFVRLDALASALGAQLTVRASGARIDLGGTAIDLRDGVQYVRVGGAQYPLIVAPVRDASGVLVPVQFALDLLPRVVRTFAYDPATRTLRPARNPGRVAARDAGSGSPPGAPTPNEESAAEAPAVRLPSIGPRTRQAARPQSRGEPRVDAAAPPAVDVRPSPPDLPADAAIRGRRLVAVDAGHGGPDAGMRGALADGTPLLEKDITLGVARALRDALTERGVGVVMTRTTDTLIALGDRGRIANARHADLFVSVHVNAANPSWHDPTAARGFETYFLSEARTEEARQVADRENASTRFELAPTAGSDPLRFVMSDLAQNAHLRESSRLAAAVQTRLARVHPGPNRRVHQAGFKVLVTAAMPAVLVEVGFGSNPEDAAYLASSRGRRELADAIAGAVSDFLVRYARSSAE